MHKTLISATRVTALGLLLGLAMGCATRGQLDEVRATAENALSEARTASQTANDSMDEIRSARDACCRPSGRPTTPLPAATKTQTRLNACSRGR